LRDRGRAACVTTIRFEGHTAQALQRIEGDMMALLRRVKPDARIAQRSH
jgi:phosphomannomutase